MMKDERKYMSDREILDKYIDLDNCLLVETFTTNPILCPKIAGHINTLTPSMLDIIKNNIFFRLEEAMIESGESLS